MAVEGEEEKVSCSECRGVGEVGAIEVACAQLCGHSHYKMRADAVIETEDAFEKWLAAKENE